MPPSSTRRTRKRPEPSADETSDMALPESSPTRPTRKRRRADSIEANPTIRAAGKRRGKAESKTFSDVAVNGPEALLNSVIESLSTAQGEVRVAIDHGNSRLEREYRNGVQAYAKIAGATWTYYVKTLRINIGRPPDIVQSEVEPPPQSSPAPTESETAVHIDLGPSKLVSRQHATIEYSSADPAGWQVMVNGRNGVKLNDLFLKRGSIKALQSGDVLEIGGTQMMFVTPNDGPHIHAMFLQKARGQVDDAEVVDSQENGHPVSEVANLSLLSSSQHPPASVNQATAGSASFAPDSADHRRQTTPTSSRGADRDHQPKQSPAYNRGLMLETTEEIDYSQDSARDLKPPYSYATMIGQAILGSEEEKLTLNAIYQWIMDRYAFYRHSNSGWQNSIRHNLSLNKAFEKIPRRTDEPGKGMKWQIVPQHRDEFTRKASRPPNKSHHRSSSTPNSPGTKDMTSMMNLGGGLMNLTYKQRSAAIQVMKSNSRAMTPPRLGFHMVSSKEAFTPDRGPQFLGSARLDGDAINGGNGSPLPADAKVNIFGSYSPSNAGQASPPPTLSSSAYLDGSQSMVTPAPRRREVRLAPPSTAQVPSMYMPASSPAPFWKYVEFGSTPARPLPDFSPSKGGDVREVHSSSPPPQVKEAGHLESPSKAGTGNGSLGTSLMRTEEEKQEKILNLKTSLDDMGTGYDLARGFRKIGSFQSRVTNATV